MCTHAPQGNVEGGERHVPALPERGLVRDEEEADVREVQRAAGLRHFVLGGEGEGKVRSLG